MPPKNKNWNFEMQKPEVLFGRLRQTRKARRDFLVIPNLAPLKEYSLDFVFSGR
jgi:hypothetical protein